MSSDDDKAAPNPMTLYSILGVPEDTPPELVGAATLVDGPGAAASEAHTAAVGVLSDAAARADYDRRFVRGLAFELALAWGVAALADGEGARAHEHFARAVRIAPEDRAATALQAATEGLADGTSGAPGGETRAGAAEQIERLRYNAAFPHRLLRYAEALAHTDPAAENGRVMAGAARELLQYDIAEAPRAYALTLPVVREHYPAVWALDAPFFEAALSVLVGRAPGPGQGRNRGGAGDYALEDLIGPSDLTGPKGRSVRRPEPRQPEPTRPKAGGGKVVLARLPNPRQAAIGAIVGALFGLRMGPFGMLRGAAIGFVAAYAILLVMERRR